MALQYDGIIFEESPNRLRISWDNREVRKENFAFWFILVIWILFASASVYATASLFTANDPIPFAIWCVFGWPATFSMPRLFARRSWSEWIEIDAKAISWGATGPMTEKDLRIPLLEIEEFALGRNSDREESESLYSLNVYQKPRSRFGPSARHVLGYWLARKNKEKIFEQVSAFVEQRSLPLKVITYGDR